jgi:hypothetical protein
LLIEAISVGFRLRLKTITSEIKPLKQGNEMIDMLMKIYNFMNKNFEEDKLHREKLANFKEEQLQEDERRHKALLKAIEDLMKDKSGKVTPEKEKEGGNLLDSIFGAVGGISTLLNIARIVFMNPFALAILGAASIAALMALSSKESHETASKVQNAMDLSAGGAEIMEAASDTIEARKNKLLSERPKDKKRSKIYPFLDSKELQDSYLKEIGFDPKTGLTDAEKLAGFTGIGEDLNPIKPKETTTPATPAPSTPATPADAATPAATTPPTAKLNAVQSENNTAKVNNLTTPATSTINNVKATTNEKTKPQDRMKMLSVRNQEETFQRMITYSTRVV